MMKPSPGIKISRLILKIIIFLLLFNLICILITYFPIGKLSLYNKLFPGRPRMPFGENSSQSFNLTLNNMDAMIASHEISKTSKNPETFRIFLIGDSSIWGFMQKPSDTLAGLLNKGIDFECEGKPIEVINFGYPSLSVLKDLFFIHRAIDFEPDLFLWFVTLESLNNKDQLATPLVQNNPAELIEVISEYGLKYDPKNYTFWDRTLVKQRRNFADLLRLQIYGIMWAATGIDQELPETFTPALRDFDADLSYKNYIDQEISAEDLALDVIEKTIDKITTTDLILINEPILISKGKNSEFRYNFYYPRWAYDQYREIINNFVRTEQIKYYDFWDLVPETNFTNSAIHLDIFGEELLAKEIRQIIEDHCAQ